MVNYVESEELLIWRNHESMKESACVPFLFGLHELQLVTFEFAAPGVWRHTSSFGRVYSLDRNVSTFIFQLRMEMFTLVSRQHIFYHSRNGSCIHSQHLVLHHTGNPSTYL